ncbi:hypothetical protein PCASD_07877 [Puccinia coronata f. sp. avenae]|uniref:Secreted protein n=1 Tax=Puccinia coronata f. sp. avenae TaxID=200324 RepID=A0A2N5UQ66_9BASI|nr:hypothetical protein PCASD_07877 [Puccinia coronata f. sp. avenae]
MFRSSWILCAQMSSVLIALITLPSVRTTHREYSSTPQQCGIHYSLDGDLAELATASTVHCINYGNVKYQCDRNSCHGGSEKATPSSSPFSKFAFYNCRAHDDYGNLLPNRDQTVYPNSFTASNRIMKLDVVGDANKDGDGIAHFNCDYTKQSDLNSRRPWCNRCWLNK